MSLRFQVYVLVASVAAVATSASAGFQVEVRSDSSTTGDNILFNSDPPPGLTLTGVTNGAPALQKSVFFYQPQAAETILGKVGQATVNTFVKNGTFTSLGVKLGDGPFFNGLGFTDFEMNPGFVSDGLSFQVFVYDYLGSLLNPSPVSLLSKNGNNFFGVKATGTTLLGAVEIVGPVDALQDVKQVRIGGISAPVATPEPGTLTLLAVGGLGMAGGWYRNRRKAAA